MAKERLVEQLRRDPLHDRHRLLGRLAHAAAGRQRLPRHLPGHPAAVQLPGRVVDGPAARRLPPVRRYFENPAKWGTGVVWTPAQIAAVEGHPNHVNSIVFDTRLLDRRWAFPTTAAPGVPADGRLQRADQPRRRALHAGRLHDQRPRAAAASAWIRARAGGRPRLRGPAARQRRRPVRARGAQEGARSRPAQFVDLNAKIGGGDIDINPTAERLEADEPALRERLPQRRDQQRQQPQQGRDHRPPRARPGRLPRRLPLVGDPRAARARARHVRQPGDLVRRGAADGRLRANHSDLRPDPRSLRRAAAK